MNESQQTRLHLGIDLGGTNIKAGVVDDSGHPLGFSTVPTEANAGPLHGVKQMALAAEQAMQKAGVTSNQISAAGLASPGTMDIPAGMLLEPTNLPGWNNFPIRDKVAESLGLPTILQNDANAAAYGEYWAGQAKHAQSLAFYTLGTGLGGGLIIDDHIIEGRHSHGGELGHVILEAHDGRYCNTGQYGTAEAYVSATALLRRFNEQLETGAVTSVRSRLLAGQKLTPLVITEEAEHGDHLSLDLIMEMAQYLGATITSCVHVIDPDMVLLGGAMTFGRDTTRVGREFIQRVRQEFRTRTFPTLANSISIDWASLGGDAGFIGAAGCARLAFLKNRLPVN